MRHYGLFKNSKFNIFLDFFEIDSNHLKIVSSVNNPTNDLWILALALRFDKRMMELIDEEKNYIPVLL